MATYKQSLKIGELSRLGYVTVEHPDHEGLADVDLPIGGPVAMLTPTEEIVIVYPDGSVLPYK